ncbi:50S ribosomal protein L21e [Candidatus Woesearchaeota archaeon]|nr:50S ribosomal protein L21e [Candidatus Woesearchaeota archaeon]
MTKRIGSLRRKTRKQMTKPASLRGKYPLRALTQSLKAGDRVVFSAEPSYHNGLFFRRFRGKTGLVVGKRGRCCEVSVSDGGKEKLVIVNPVHLARL